MDFSAQDFEKNCFPEEWDSDKDFAVVGLDSGMDLVALDADKDLVVLDFDTGSVDMDFAGKDFAACTVAGTAADRKEMDLPGKVEYAVQDVVW